MFLGVTEGGLKLFDKLVSGGRAIRYPRVMLGCQSSRFICG